MGDLDAIIKRAGNIVALRELAELRRIDRAARALVRSWQVSGRELGGGELELAAAVIAAGGYAQVPGQEGRA